jgi:hypothetical protein
MDAYARAYLLGWSTDSFDSWSQLHKCLSFALPLSQGNLCYAKGIFQNAIFGD